MKLISENRRQGKGTGFKGKNGIWSKNGNGRKIKLTPSLETATLPKKGGRGENGTNGKNRKQGKNECWEGLEIES